MTFKQVLRRNQYIFMSFILFCLLLVIPFIKIEIGVIFGIIILMIVAAILLNGRDRDFDINAFTNLFDKILGRK